MSIDLWKSILRIRTISFKYDIKYPENLDIFTDADLLGVPIRAVVSEKTLKDDSVEIKKRDSAKAELVKIVDLYNSAIK